MISLAFRETWLPLFFFFGMGKSSHTPPHSHPGPQPSALQSGINTLLFLWKAHTHPHGHPGPRPSALQPRINTLVIFVESRIAVWRKVFNTSRKLLHQRIKASFLVKLRILTHIQFQIFVLLMLWDVGAIEFVSCPQKKKGIHKPDSSPPHSRD